jgi:hypothetical protein
MKDLEGDKLMISLDTWINLMFLNLINKLTPLPPLFFKKRG